MMRRWLAGLVVAAVACGGAAAQDAVRTGARLVVGTPAEVMGAEAAAARGDVMAVNQRVQWEVYTPSQYDPANPPGVLVYISPSKSGRPPREWLEVMKAQNLIWIGAERSGNETPTDARIMMAIMGLQVIEREYEIDPARVYLSGFSGGGRTAGITMGMYPELFRGAIYICGVNFWGDVSEAALGMIRENAYVFLTGTRDFNQAGTARVFRQYRDAGVERALAMVITGLGHALPEAEDLNKAIDFLDERGGR